MLISVVLFKIASYISSLLPLGIYCLIKYRGSNKSIFFQNWLSWISPQNLSIGFMLLQIISAIFVIILLKIKNKETNAKSYTIKSVSQEKTATSNYILSNIIAVISMGYDVEGVIFSILLLVGIGIIYYKNNLYYINPLYDILNIKIYTCDIQEFHGKLDNDNYIYKNIMILSKHKIYTTDIIKLIKNEDIYFLKE